MLSFESDEPLTGTTNQIIQLVRAPMQEDHCEIEPMIQILVLDQLNLSLLMICWFGI